MSKSVKEYIISSWDRSIFPSRGENEKQIALPHPFSVPSSYPEVENSAGYTELFYWDTYFINVGLLRSGRAEQAKNNCDNMAYLVDRFGFMPNASRFCYVTQKQSQPPFLSQMVREVYEYTGDKQWLAEMYQILKKEYNFWQTNRNTETGLNRYFGTYPNDNDMAHNAKSMCKRFGVEPPESIEELRQYGDSYKSFCESGWDCTSRFKLEGQNINAVDLNSLLYGMECNMAFFAKELCIDEDKNWLQKAQIRKEKMNKLLYSDQKGAFYDYNYKNKTNVDLFSAASFYPLTFNLCTKEQAEKTVEKLKLIEFSFGVAASENREDLFNLQWDYPYAWPPIQHIVIKGLLNYGYKEEALRIAKTYVDTLDKNFEKTGYLWEKYNALTGEKAVTKEYITKEMLGWTAAVYLYCDELLNT